MQLLQLRVRNYKTIDDSGWVDLDDITCLVGRNESGKTAFLRAIERLNPAYGDGSYDVYTEYPRDRWATYRERHDEDPDPVVSARFRLADDEVAQIESAFGDGVVADPVGIVSKNYANELRWELDLDETAFEPSDEVDATDAEEMGFANLIGTSVLADAIPTFLYVDEYTLLSGRIDLAGLRERQDTGDETQSDAAFLSLLSIAGVDLDDLTDDADRRERVAELESASRTMSQQAMRYWSQNEGVRLRLRLAGEDNEEIEIRVEDVDTDITVEFDSRSHGFRWFVSTFCTLYDLATREDGPVLLLDEPGLNLHAKAKSDFLTFLEREVATNRAVVYTTHSPHMIDPDRLHRVKPIRADPPSGPNVVTDIANADPDTRFLLKNVVELGMIDALLARPQTLLVPEDADHTYLHAISQSFVETGRDGLDPRWTIVPVGGEANVPWFVSLMDSVDLDVAALLSDRSRIEDELSAEESPIDGSNVQTVGEFVDVNGPATVEDLFSTPYFLAVVNEAYRSELEAAGTLDDRLTEADLPARPAPIVDRLTAVFEEHEVADSFDRDRVARYFQRQRSDLPELDGDSSRTFSGVFRAFNTRLESFEGVSKRRKTIRELLNLG